MFKKFKTEFFFIAKLFGNKYPLKYYFSYFKNKLWGDYYLSKLRPVRCLAGNDLEIHVLCQKKDLEMLEWNIRSFVYYSGLCPRVVVHDDGSIDAKAADLIESRISNLRILFKSEADKIINNSKDLTDKVREFRNKGHIMIMEFFDLYFFGYLSDAKNIMILDSDVLFLNKPQEIVDFVNGKNSCDAMISRQYGTYDLKINESYAKILDTEKKETGYMNPGLIIYKNGSLSLKSFVEYFDHTERNIQDYFLGMAGWGCLVSQTKFDFLPGDKYKIKWQPNENTVMKHFTSPRRHEFYAYGIDMIKSKIKN